MPLSDSVDKGLKNLSIVEETSSEQIRAVLGVNERRVLEFLLENKNSFPEQVVDFERGLPRAQDLVRALTFGLPYFFDDKGIYEYADLLPVRRGNGVGEQMGVTDTITVVKKPHPNTFGLDTFSGLILGIRQFLEGDGKQFDVKVPSGYYVFKFEEQWAGGGQESDMSEKTLIFDAESFNIESAQDAFERFAHYCMIQSGKQYFQHIRMAVPERDKWFWLPDEYSVKSFGRFEIHSLLPLPPEVIRT